MCKKDNIYYVSFTWHREESLRYYLKQDNIDMEEFKEMIFNIIRVTLLVYWRKKIIFQVWGSDGFDNIVWEVLADHGLDYILYLSEKDKSWRNYWTQKQKEQFDKVYNNASKVILVKWWYIERDKRLIENADEIVVFIGKGKMWKSWTWTTFNLFLQKNIIEKKRIIIDEDCKNCKNFSILNVGSINSSD